MSDDGAVLVSRAGYLRALDDVASRRASVASSVRWPDPVAWPVDAPCQLVALGGSSPAAQVLIDALERKGAVVASRLVEPDEVDAQRASRQRFVFVSASGASPSMAAAIDRCADGPAPVLFTLDPASRCAQRTRQAGGLVVAPDVAIVADEFLATANLDALLALIAHAFADGTQARGVARAFDQGRACAAPPAASLRRVSRIVLIADREGRAAAIDFGTRCREFGTHPVTELTFAGFVHGSYNAVPARGRGDVPWTVLFVQSRRARTLARLLVDDAVRTIVPIAGASLVPQARALGSAVALHRAFVEAALPGNWSLPHTSLGEALWKQYR